MVRKNTTVAPVILQNCLGTRKKLKIAFFNLSEKELLHMQNVISHIGVWPNLIMLILSFSTLLESKLRFFFFDEVQKFITCSYKFISLVSPIVHPISG